MCFLCHTASDTASTYNTQGFTCQIKTFVIVFVKEIIFADGITQQIESACRCDDCSNRKFRNRSCCCVRCIGNPDSQFICSLQIYIVVTSTMTGYDL